jgi:hypothetical protein
VLIISGIHVGKPSDPDRACLGGFCVCVCGVNFHHLVTKGKGATTFPKSPYQEGKKKMELTIFRA